MPSHRVKVKGYLATKAGRGLHALDLPYPGSAQSMRPCRSPTT